MCSVVHKQLSCTTNAHSETDVLNLDVRGVKVKEMAKETGAINSKKGLSHLIRRPPINIEFQDLTYTVPQGRKGGCFYKSYICLDSAVISNTRYGKNGKK